MNILELPAAELAILAWIATGSALAGVVTTLMLFGRNYFRYRADSNKHCATVAHANELEARLKEAEEKTRLGHLEIELLTEFLIEPDVARAMKQLLTRLVPDASRGLALIAESSGEGSRTRLARGIRSERYSNIDIDSDWWTLAKNEPFREVPASELRQSEFYQSLDRKERASIEQLFVVAIGTPESVIGLLLTTDLYPKHASRNEQIRLTSKLMSNVATQYSQLQTIAKTSEELNTTQALLEMRAAADQPGKAPKELVTDVLNNLLELIEFERASIYLSRDAGGKSAPARWLSTGITQAPHVAEAYTRREEELVVVGATQAHYVPFDHQLLSRIGIDTLIGTALVLRLTLDPQTDAILILTRSSIAQVKRSAEGLAQWCARFLGHQLLDAVDRTRMERQARTDGLTGLANRAAIDRKLEQQLKRIRTQQGLCSLLILDLDHFKSINDRYGHQAGDVVLQEVSEILLRQAQIVRSTDEVLCGRYGGEEMVMLLPGIGLSGATRIAESVRSMIEAHRINTSEHQIMVTTSIGVACAPQHGETPSKLIAAADAALYQAKNSGRNRFVVATARRLDPDSAHQSGATADSSRI